MNNYRKIRHIIFLFIYVLVAVRVYSVDKLKFASIEKVPYVGKGLNNYGYVYEVLKEAYSRVGFEIEIEFYPLARSLALAKSGSVDGILPVYFDESLKSSLDFSNPFPGNTIGLLKRKNSELSIKSNITPRDTDYFRSLEGYSIGVVRGSTTTKAFDTANYLNKHFVKDDYQNLLLLSLNRLDLIVIDKYTASEIMSNSAPHMIGKFEFIEPPIASMDFHVGFSKKTKNYNSKILAFNKGLDEIVNDGTMEDILRNNGLLNKQKSNEGESKVLRIASVDNNEMKTMQKLSKIYEEENPGIKIEWNIMDEKTLRSRLLSSISVSDGKYDIMTIGAFETPIWGENEWIVPVDNLPPSYDIDDIIKTVRDILSFNNKLYALPFYAESSMTYYRKDLFQKAGITMPENPTYEEIRSFAAKIHNPYENIYGIGLRGESGWGMNMCFLSTLVNSFGGRWFDEKWNPEIDSNPWNKAVGYYKDLLNNYGPENITSYGFNEIKDLFANGNCGIWIDATVAAGMLFDPIQSKVYDKVGFVSAPYSVTRKGSNWLWAWALAIPSSSVNQQEALDFIKWATSKEYIELVGRREGWVAVPPGTRYSTYKNINYTKVAPFAEFVLKAIESANPLDPTLKKVPYTGVQYVGIPEFPAIGLQVGNEIVKIFDEDAKVGTVLKNSQEIVDKIMMRSGYKK